jgi:hypothetical protein
LRLITARAYSPGLQQTRDKNRLEVADRDRLVLVVDQRDQLLGHPGAVLLEPAWGVLIPAQRQQPVALRALDPAHPRNAAMSTSPT